MKPDFVTYLESVRAAMAGFGATGVDPADIAGNPPLRRFVVILWQDGVSVDEAAHLTIDEFSDPALHITASKD